MARGHDKAQWNHTAHILAFIFNSVSRKLIRPDQVNPYHRAPSSKDRPKFECSIREMIDAFVTPDNPSRAVKSAKP